jgi:hypothetical protein
MQARAAVLSLRRIRWRFSAVEFTTVECANGAAMSTGGAGVPNRPVPFVRPIIPAIPGGWKWPDFSLLGEEVHKKKPIVRREVGTGTGDPFFHPNPHGRRCHRVEFLSFLSTVFFVPLDRVQEKMSMNRSSRMLRKFSTSFRRDVASMHFVLTRCFPFLPSPSLFLQIM